MSARRSRGLRGDRPPPHRAWPSRSACCCSATGRRGPCSASPSPQARGHVHKVEGVRTVATFHPRHLINRPSDKALGMAGPVAVDGGRGLKAGLFALAALSGPLPLARAGPAGAAVRSEPLPSSRQPAHVLAPAVDRHRAASASRRPPVPPDARDLPPIRFPRTGAECSTRSTRGNWASAQAGIAMLPPQILTPVAKAELYTAKGSPMVDLGSLQALIAEAPELPQADQLARMALTRGATTPPLIVPERPTRAASARRRAATAPSRSRASPTADAAARRARSADQGQ